MDYARSLISELMNPYEQDSKRKLDDKDICPNFIAGFCPHDLFVNTKADLGPCDKVHEEYLRKEYQELKDKSKYDFEEIFLRTVRNLVEDVDRKVKRAKEKVEQLEDEENRESKKAEVEEKIVIIDEKIKGLLALAEAAGEEGRISEAKSYSSQVEALQAELERLKKSFDPDYVDPDGKAMEVCEVCAAYLVAGNEPKRLEAHVTGKMHTGYLKIREIYNEKVKNKRSPSPEEHIESKYSYENSRYGRYSRSRNYYDRDRDYEYSSPLDNRRSYRDRERDRSPRRRYSRDRSPGRDRRRYYD